MHLLLVIVFTRALVTCNEKLHSSHAAASTFKVCARKQNLLTLRIACHKQFGQIKMKILWYSSRHTLIYRKKDGKPRMISGQFVAVRVGSTNSSSLHTPLILCFKSAIRDDVHTHPRWHSNTCTLIIKHRMLAFWRGGCLQDWLQWLYHSTNGGWSGMSANRWSTIRSTTTSIRCARMSTPQPGCVEQSEVFLVAYRVFSLWAQPCCRSCKARWKYAGK